MLLSSKPSYDALLSVDRLKPETSFGPISAIIEEEFGDDARLLLGDHADTAALLSTAILNTPKGEQGLRRFLRHLRELLGQRPTYVLNLQRVAAKAGERAAQEKNSRLRAEATIAAVSEELARERGLMAEERAAWAGERDGFAQALNAERGAWRAECDRLQEALERSLKKASEAAHVIAAEEIAAGATWAASAKMHEELVNTRSRLELETARRKRIEGDLSYARWLLVDREQQIHELSQRDTGAWWLSKGSRR